MSTRVVMMSKEEVPCSRTSSSSTAVGVHVATSRRVADTPSKSSKSCPAAPGVACVCMSERRLSPGVVPSSFTANVPFEAHMVVPKSMTCDCIATSGIDLGSIKQTRKARANSKTWKQLLAFCQACWHSTLIRKPR
jgi:hypothetical protein